MSDEACNRQSEYTGAAVDHPPLDLITFDEEAEKLNQGAIKAEKLVTIKAQSRRRSSSQSRRNQGAIKAEKLVTI